MQFKAEIIKTCRVERDPRFLQIVSMFDLSDNPEHELRWCIDIDLPDDWSVGAIVGNSGSGKTIIARELARVYGTKLIEQKDSNGNLCEPFTWPANRAICSVTKIPIKEWINILGMVGFSSPPAWCRPYYVLSQGQQFRANLARAIAESGDKPVFYDEFASLVHSSVAKIASAAASKIIRKLKKQLVAVTWRTDILDWLEPDWVLFVRDDKSVQLETARGIFSPGGKRKWQRPPIQIQIVRVRTSEAWPLFREHHYLSRKVDCIALSFVAMIEKIPAAFCAMVIRPANRKFFYCHRLVCLPDYQGIGIGRALLEYVASMLACYYPCRITTSHPGLVASLSRSKNWVLIKAHSFSHRHAFSDYDASRAYNRWTTSFEYRGPIRKEESMKFGLRIKGAISHTLRKKLSSMNEFRFPVRQISGKLKKVICQQQCAQL